MLGGINPLMMAPAAAFTTWNPADKDAALVLSMGNLQAQSPGSWVSTRSIKPIASGKGYCEVKNIATGNCRIGIANSSEGLGSAGGGANSIVYDRSGQIVGVGSNLAEVPSFSVNDVIGIAVDRDAPSIRFYLNGSLVFSTGSLPSGAIFALAMIQNTVLANFGASAFAYTPPSGYPAWG